MAEADATRTCVVCGVLFAWRANKLYCSRACKDKARDKDLLRASSKAWLKRNPGKASAAKAAYRKRVGRGDRSGEYAKRRTKMGRPVGLLWIDAAYHLAHAEALVMDASINHERRALLKAERKAERDTQDALRRELAKGRGVAASTRSHDHMQPLASGGVHSAANIAPCCLDCNSRKGAKGFAQWVATLAPKNAARAVKFFEKRNGPMMQMGLSLAA